MASSQAGYYQDYARREARAAGLPEEFVVALFDTESNWNPQATSPKNARGIAQFIPATGSRYGLKTEEDFYNPEKSISAGVRHLKDLYDKYEGDLEKTAAAYNAGSGAVDRYGGMPPFKETRNYWNRIQRKMGETDTSTGNPDTETYGYPSGERYRESSNESDPTPNMTTPLSTPTQWQLPPQEGETQDPFTRLAGDPFLQMGLGILGARTGSGIRNIASGIQSGLSAVQRFRAYRQLQDIQRQKAQAGPADTTRMRDFAFLLQQGVPRSEAIERVFGNRQGTVVNVGQQGMGGPQYGSVPSGHTRVIDPETGIATDIPNPGTKTQVEREADKAFWQSGLSRIDELMGLIKEHGTEALPFVSNQVVRGTMEQLRQSLIPVQAKLANAGVLEEGERKALEAALTDPSDFWSYFKSNPRILAQFETFRKLVAERANGAGSSGSTKTITSDNDPLGIR